MTRAVPCVDCGKAVAEAEAELSPNGWRCRKCSLQHQIDIHGGADDQVGELSIDQMQQRAGNALAYAGLAIVASVACAILLATATFGEGGVEGKALWAVPAGVAVAGYEIVAWRKARKAIAIMRRRLDEH